MLIIRAELDEAPGVPLEFCSSLALFRPAWLYQCSPPSASG
jgi:hypothetical protein